MPLAISIHALRKESDILDKRRDSAIIKFQSTLSVRRATTQTAHLLIDPAISIHALRKESDPARRAGAGEQCISIHALRKESDLPYGNKNYATGEFQSTLSVRRATPPTIP